MKSLILFLFINCCVYGYSQVVPDSLYYVEQQLNLKFLTQTKDFYEGKDDFVFVRVNDSLSYENNSYKYVYNKDSCSHGGTVSFDTTRLINGSKYYLANGHIGFSYANGKSDCVNALTPDEDIRKILPYLKTEDIYVKHSDLNNYEYTIYGRIGDKYIYETFNREYANKPENALFLEFISLFCNLYTFKSE